MERIYQEYTTRSTWKVIERILEDSFLYTDMCLTRTMRFGKFTAKTIEEYIKSINDVYAVYSDLSDVDWQQVADELNNS